MRDYYSRDRRVTLTPPKVNDSNPSTFISLLAASIVSVIGIFGLAGVMWLALSAVDAHSLASFSELLGLSGAYLMFRIVDRVLFGIRKSGE